MDMCWLSGTVGWGHEDPPPQAWKLLTCAMPWESSGQSVTWCTLAGRPQQSKTAALGKCEDVRDPGEVGPVLPLLAKSP